MKEVFETYHKHTRCKLFINKYDIEIISYIIISNMDICFDEPVTDKQLICANELVSVRDAIESMNKFNQIEVLRILKNHETITLNENKYGIHINITDISSNILQELKEFIEYVDTQENTLQEVEQQKEDFKNNYFTKHNKD